MLDFAKVRAFYFDPPADDPARIPSREELYARFERERFEHCLVRGGDPEAEGLGPHGSLIGGANKPLTFSTAFPSFAPSSVPCLSHGSTTPGATPESFHRPAPRRRTPSSPRSPARTSPECPTDLPAAFFAATFGLPNSPAGHGPRSGTSLPASIPSTCTDCFPAAPSHSTRRPASSTSPTPAAPTSSAGSTNSAAGPSDRRSPGCDSQPRRLRRIPAGPADKPDTGTA